MNKHVEKKREAAERAMPEVKRLVSKHGRTVISYCLNQLKDYEMKLARLEKAKEEIKELEKEVK